MFLAATRGTRWLRPLALALLLPGWLGCGGSSGGNGPDPKQEAVDYSKTAKDNYLKSRAERKGQAPSHSGSGSNSSRYAGRR